jgi:hypothetical protein
LIRGPGFPSLFRGAVPVLDYLSIPVIRNMSKLKRSYALFLSLGVGDLLLEDKRDHVPFGDDVGRRPFHFRADIVASGLRKRFYESDQRGPISSRFAARHGWVVLDKIGRDVLPEQIRVPRLEDQTVEVRDDLLIESRAS